MPGVRFTRSHNDGLIYSDIAVGQRPLKFKNDEAAISLTSGTHSIRWRIWGPTGASLTVTMSTLGKEDTEIVNSTLEESHEGRDSDFTIFEVV